MMGPCGTADVHANPWFYLDAVHLGGWASLERSFSLILSGLGALRIETVAHDCFHEPLAFLIQERDESLLKREVAVGFWGRMLRGWCGKFRIEIKGVELTFELVCQRKRLGPVNGSEKFTPGVDYGLGTLRRMCHLVTSKSKQFLEIPGVSMPWEWISLQTLFSLLTPRIISEAVRG